MTGVAIRMAQSLGLHRDGSHFPQLTPYEVEIRRRVWWSLCFLDVRSSEDQGMDYTILPRSFDTKFPLSVNDADISPESKETPSEGPGLTNMTLPLDMCKICDLTRRIMDKDRAPTLQYQRQLVTELYGTLEKGYMQYASSSDNPAVWWVAVTAIRLTMAKMTLFINFPVLFSPHHHQQQQHTEANDEAASTRNILLAAAIEVAEWNHALNAEPAARQWRWLYQTYTHWHAVVILLIEIARRPLSPLVERAWLALRSGWLIPAPAAGGGGDKKKELQIWVPLRRLMAKARRHRDAEIERLRDRGPEAVAQTAAGDCAVPAPGSVCPLLGEEELRMHWDGLFVAEAPTVQLQQPIGTSSAGESADFFGGAEEDVIPSQPGWGSLPPGQQDFFAGMGGMGSQSSQGFSGVAENSPMGTAAHQTSQTAEAVFVPVASAWPGPQQFDANAIPWLWADADPATEVFGADLDINMDSESDWHNWLESAKNMELNPDGA